MGAVPPDPKPSTSWSTEIDRQPAEGRRLYRRPHPLRTLGQALGGGALLLAGLAVVGLWRSPNRLAALTLGWLTPTVSAPQVDVRSVVVQQLRGASDLTTAIFAMEAVVPSRSDRTVAGYVIGSTNLLYIAYGEVRAGVDLSQITAQDIQVGDQTSLRLTLPPPQILDSKLDLTRSTVYDYDRGFLGLGPDNAPSLQDQAQRQALAKIEAAACSQGLLLEANRRAQLTVEQLLATAGFPLVTVVTQPPPATCASPVNSDTVIPGQS